MARSIESLRGETRTAFSIVENFRGKIGEVLFGTTKGESDRMMAFYGLVMLIGIYARNPVVFGVGFAGLALSWKESAMAASVGAVGVANAREEAKARNDNSSNSRNRTIA